ncbi:helix-turn-helix domain-containing protein [Paenibacillus macerans]|uniref:Helix-turn-helix domain-containing protein n=2 Tax=Paenibacillus macerans TaxID=44252 RepID=A0A6N8EY23_PAEMA|nr:helix-turn-helix domain-containing protein [Paenibacillus macerans]
MNLSNSIKKAMNEQGVTPTEVAKQTGYTPQYLHSLLDGNRRWNETTLSKACDVLGLEIKLVPKTR